eukprot:SAG11_NODE_1186_length_5590_cov_2.852850_5_plen_42_part_00
MELNKALQDEVLFFTLLGLRTSAAKACMVGPLLDRNSSSVV